MNRPSRTDDDLEHPTWNQNPPFLAADLTTRQDLNGIANAREHRSQCAGPADGLGSPDDEKHARDFAVSDLDGNTGLRPGPAMSAGLVRTCVLLPDGESLMLTSPPAGTLIAGPKAVLGGEGQACHSAPPIRPPSGWIVWVMSVVIASTVINIAGNRVLALFASTAKPAVLNVAKGRSTLLSTLPGLKRRH